MEKEYIRLIGDPDSGSIDTDSTLIHMQRVINHVIDGLSDKGYVTITEHECSGDNSMINGGGDDKYYPASPAEGEGYLRIPNLPDSYAEIPGISKRIGDNFQIDICFEVESYTDFGSGKEIPLLSCETPGAPSWKFAIVGSPISLKLGSDLVAGNTYWEHEILRFPQIRNETYFRFKETSDGYIESSCSLDGKNYSLLNKTTNVIHTLAIKSADAALRIGRSLSKNVTDSAFRVNFIIISSDKGTFEYRFDNSLGMATPIIANEGGLNGMTYGLATQGYSGEPVAYYAVYPDYDFIFSHGKILRIYAMADSVGTGVCLRIKNGEYKAVQTGGLLSGKYYGLVWDGFKNCFLCRNAF